MISLKLCCFNGRNSWIAVYFWDFQRYFFCKDTIRAFYFACTASFQQKLVTIIQLSWIFAQAVLEKNSKRSPVLPTSALPGFVFSRRVLAGNSSFKCLMVHQDYSLTESLGTPNMEYCNEFVCPILAVNHLGSVGFIRFPQMSVLLLLSSLGTAVRCQISSPFQTLSIQIYKLCAFGLPQKVWG